MGVRLIVVRQDEAGRELLPGKPPLSILRTHDLGGIVDTRTRRFCAASDNPVVWFCSEVQEEIVLHGPEQPLCIIVDGAMGGGKTETLAPWTILRAIERTGIPGAQVGCTAPTEKKLITLQRKIVRLLPHDWYVWRARDSEFRLANGVSIPLRALKRWSADGGVPIEGLDLTDCASDEHQDAISDREVEPAIDTRGRHAPNGEFRRLVTCTAKQSRAYRDFKDEKAKSPFWGHRRLRGPDNPFVAASWWERLKKELSPRDYERVVEAKDLPPEEAVYHAFLRDRNIRPIPRIGARDVTAQIVAPYAKNRPLIIGHDPGQYRNVSILLKAYQLASSDEIAWWVVGEFVTNRTTTLEHGTQLRQFLRDEWGLNIASRHHEVDPIAEQAHLRLDPYSDSDTNDKPERSVLVDLKSIGFDCRWAQYDKKGRGRGRIPREDRIAMVNGLLYSADHVSRLFIGCDDRKRPVAPGLVDALEFSKRGDDGKAETSDKRKKKDDLTDWSCSLGYGLWPWEKPRYRDRNRKDAPR